MIKYGVIICGYNVWCYGAGTFNTREYIKGLGTIFTTTNINDAFGYREDIYRRNSFIQD